MESEIAIATFKVPRGLLDQFRTVAKSHERTFSGEIRKVMAEYVKAQHGQDGNSA